MPRKGENIYKRKDGRWEGRYIKDRKASGKAVYGYIYARTYHDVKYRLREAEQVCCRYSSENCNISKSKERFSEIAVNWLEQKKPQFKESTYTKYQNLLQCYILPNLGEISLSQL